MSNDWRHSFMMRAASRCLTIVSVAKHWRIFVSKWQDVTGKSDTKVVTAPLVASNARYDECGLVSSVQ